MSTATYLPTQAAIPNSTLTHASVVGDATAAGDRTGAVVPQEFAAVLRDSAQDVSDKSAVAAGDTKHGRADALLTSTMSLGRAAVPTSGPPSKLDRDAVHARAMQGQGTPQDNGLDSDSQTKLPTADVHQVATEKVVAEDDAVQVPQDVLAVLDAPAVQERAKVMYASQEPRAAKTAGAADLSKSKSAAVGVAVKSGENAKSRPAMHEEKGPHKKKAGLGVTASGEDPFDSAAYLTPVRLPWVSAAAMSGADRPKAQQTTDNLAVSQFPTGTAVSGAAATTAASTALGREDVPTLPANRAEAASPVELAVLLGQEGSEASEPVAVDTKSSDKFNGAESVRRAASDRAASRRASKGTDTAGLSAVPMRVEDANGSLSKSGNVVLAASPAGRAEAPPIAEQGRVSDSRAVLQTAALPEHGSAMRLDETVRRGQIEMRIDDAALGPVHVQATLDGNGGVHVGIAGQSGDAHAALEQIAPLLHAAVAQQVDGHSSTAASVHVMSTAERAADSPASGLFPAVRMGSGGAPGTGGDAFGGGFDGAAQQRPGQQGTADGSRNARGHRQPFNEQTAVGHRAPVAVAFAPPAAWNRTHSGGLSVRI